MPCPIHHFAPVRHCPMCWPFSSGFVSGFFGFPMTIWKGFNADPSVMKDMGRNIRVMWKLAKEYPPTKENREKVKETYDELPDVVKTGISTGAQYGAGSFLGGMSANTLVLMGWGRLLGLGVVRALGPAAIPTALCVSQLGQIFGGIFLTWHSLLGTSSRIIDVQRNALRSVPNGEQLYEEETKKFLDKKPKDGSPP